MQLSKQRLEDRMSNKISGVTELNTVLRNVQGIVPPLLNQTSTSRLRKINCILGDSE